jgi:hypothetical protein
LAGQRATLTESEFVQLIVQQGGDALAGAEIWSRLKDWTYVDEFTPYPSDSLGSIFGIREEELDEDLVLDVIRELNVTTPSAKFLSDFGAIDTPIRLAQLVAHCRSAHADSDSQSGPPRSRT